MSWQLHRRKTAGDAAPGMQVVGRPYRTQSASHEHPDAIVKYRNRSDWPQLVLGGPMWQGLLRMIEPSAAVPLRDLLGCVTQVLEQISVTIRAPLSC